MFVFSCMKGHIMSAIVPFLSLMPLPLLRGFVQGWAAHIAYTFPELFARLGPAQGRRFLIDPLDLPFVFLLIPHPLTPRMEVHRRAQALAWEARIAGPFTALLQMLDGQSGDADALFFRRDIVVEGDTQLALYLRAALDDLDGSVAEAIADLYGPLGRKVLNTLAQRGI